VGLCLALPAVSQADIITFDFTGRLVVASQSGSIIGPAYTPIAASLTYDTVGGLGASGLSITMSNFFLGQPATFHDITMTRQANTNLITGQVLVDWGVSANMPLHVEWNATGLLNAIDFGLQAGDKLSGTNLYRDFNNDQAWDASEWVADINSATPYSDSLQTSYLNKQGPAPLAATSGSLGLGTTTPFSGVRGYFDIGSGNSMYVTAVTSVPVPAAAWLLGSGILGLAGFARRRQEH
jgi:hypothetical protein